jgi:integrase
MATKKIGIYRKYRGPVPKGEDGNPLPKSQWPKERAFSWCARWFGRDGKRYSRSFHMRKEACQFADHKRVEIQEGWADPPQRISLEDFRKEHKELMRGNIARSTLDMHLRAIRLLAAVLGSDRLLDTISAKDIERFRSSRLASGIAATTANMNVKFLRRVFNLATVRGYLRKGTNPCVGLPALKVASKQPRYIRPEEFQKVFALVKLPLWRAFLATVYTTGVRLREATNLTWENLDLNLGQLHVTRKDRSDLVQAWTPKDHEMRTIPLPEQTVQMLKAWREVAPQDCTYVFMTDWRWCYYRCQIQKSQWTDGKDLINGVLNRFKRLCAKVGVGPYTIHDIRRSCITNWARHLPIHVVRQLAGHSDIKTTQRYYLSVQPEDMSRVRMLQASLLSEVVTAHPADPKLTHVGVETAPGGAKESQVEGTTPLTVGIYKAAGASA